MLAGLFVCGEYVYRLAARHWYGFECVAFTPSRFVVDAAPLLAVWAGLALWRGWSRWRVGWPVRVAAAAGLAASNGYGWLDFYRAEPLPAAWRDAFAYVRQNTVPTAVVLTNHGWAPYATGRRTMYTPMPITEPAGRTPAYYQAVARQLEEPRRPLTGPRPLVGILPDADLSRLRLPHRVLWRGGGLGVYEA